MDVGYQPGRVDHLGSGLAQKFGRVLHHARRHKHGQRHDHLLSLPALHALGCRVEGIHLHPMLGAGDTQYDAPGVQTFSQRSGHALG